MSQNREIGELGQIVTVDTSANSMTVNGSIIVGNSSSNVVINSTAISVGGITETDRSYTWTNTHTFTNTVSIAALSANGTLGLSSQVLTTNGTGIYWSSAGVNTNATYATSAGSATNATYATSAGSATNATYATTSGAAAGEWRLLNTLTASSSSNLQDTSNITSTYTHYAFILNQIKPATNGTHLLMRYYVSGAFQSATYWWVGTGSNLGTGAFSTGSTNGSEIRIGNPNGINTSYDGLSGMFYLTNPSGGGYKMCYGIGGFIDGNPQQTSLWFQGAYRGSTAAVTGIQFYMSSGNIASGSISIYGIKS